MAFEYYKEHLKGKSKKVSTRVYAMPSDYFLKRYPSYAKPSPASFHMGFVNSDIQYTSEGNIESKKEYDYDYGDNKEWTEKVTEDYTAEYDSHNNLIHSNSITVGMHYDPQKKPK